MSPVPISERLRDDDLALMGAYYGVTPAPAPMPSPRGTSSFGGGLAALADPQLIGQAALSLVKDYLGWRGQQPPFREVTMEDMASGGPFATGGVAGVKRWLVPGGKQIPVGPGEFHHDALQRLGMTSDDADVKNWVRVDDRLGPRDAPVELALSFPTRPEAIQEAIAYLAARGSARPGAPIYVDAYNPFRSYKMDESFQAKSAEEAIARLRQLLQRSAE